MEHYKITVTTPAELAKAEANSDYAPAEWMVFEFQADNHRSAERTFKRMCKMHHWFNPELVCTD